MKLLDCGMWNFFAISKSPSARYTDILSKVHAWLSENMFKRKGWYVIFLLKNNTLFSMKTNAQCGYLFVQTET